jgi:exodeoxyribonuclease V gamma subunit
MFSVVFSNRHENLLDVLLAHLGAARRGPFAREQVVTPSSAMRRAIELAQAGRAGVCAALDFDYLAQWLWRSIGRVVPTPDASPYAPTALVWRLLAALDAPWTRAHPRLANYLDRAEARTRFELATRLARLFDHYLCYRPDWLERWRAGEAGGSGADAAWQAELWRRIHRNGAPPPLPFMAFLRRAADMDDAELAALGWPAAVHIFALPALPPLYLEVLHTLARVLDVRLYMLNPCREYWYDIIDLPRLSWLARRQRDLYHESGNGLLAAWGRQTQACIESLLESDTPMQDEAAFAPNPGTHLLARLQSAMLDLREPGDAPTPLAPDDRSIEVHVCHSRTRELEALHDRLLSLFAAPHPPRPGDIAVLTPDLAACAPLIEAVFGAAPPERRIPWRVTGLSGDAENPVAQALDWLLALAAGSAPASCVFDLLQHPLVAAHFGLDAAALEQVRTWLDAAGVRWGLDSEQAREAGAGGAHTVARGLERLFLSWAAGDAAARGLFADCIGVARAPRGNDGLVLGSFWRYARTLRELRKELLASHTAEGWRVLLLRVLDELVGEAPGEAEDMRAVRGAINALAGDIAAGLGEEGTPLALPLDVIHPALVTRLDERARGGVPGGMVTFSPLSSLRGLPYRIVCIIGLDHGAFPGAARDDEFDLMALEPRKGDRQRRTDDRNLFLDAVLAARDVLHLSYVGRSIRDNAEAPPSVLVDELLDALAPACTGSRTPAALAAARARLIVRHPLQAFSPAYFAPDKDDARLVNFRAEFAAALNERARRQAAPAAAPRLAADDDENDLPDDAAMPPFFTAPLPPPDEDWRRVDLAALQRFFAQPCRYLLHERLGLDLYEGEDTLSDVEPFVSGYAERRALAARLLPVLLVESDENAPETAPETALDDDTLFALARAGSEYPAGRLGESALRGELTALRTFAARVNAARAPARLPPHVVRCDFDLSGETWTLQASFAEVRTPGLIRHRYDDMRPRDYLAAWLEHLTLCAAPPAGLQCHTLGLARDGEFTLHPVPPDEARQNLAALLALYRQGLCEPLRFFPKSAWEFVQHGGDEEKARKKWRGSEWDGGYPEKNDIAYRLALRGVDDALGEKFRENSMAVFDPLRHYLVDSRLQ